MTAMHSLGQASERRAKVALCRLSHQELEFSVLSLFRPGGTLRAEADERRQNHCAPRCSRGKSSGPKIAMLTAYDATMARLLDEGGADVLLVGDSLGMVVQGSAQHAARRPWTRFAITVAPSRGPHGERTWSATCRS